MEEEMSETRVAQALARLEEHHQLHLPLRRTDVLGRLALRFLWRRQLKWQIETNMAIRDALAGIDELTRADPAELDVPAQTAPAVVHEEIVTFAHLTHEVAQLRQSDQNLSAGLNQRLYSSLGRVETQLSDLRLRFAETAENTDKAEQRLKAVDEQIAALNAINRDVRLRHAQLDLFLDKQRSARPATAAEIANTTADRESFLELALSELLDGPSEHVRTARASYLPVVAEARGRGASGPVFEMAPARGEWLEVLRSADFAYRAASDNSLVRRHCDGLGLTVEEAEPLAALAETTPRTLALITAFRYVERLSPTELARFVDLAASALQPGGALLIETPSATSAEDGDFHLDPFALRPVHPVFLRFLAEASGFSSVEIRSSGPAHETTARYCLIAWR
jgi:hypothetical protein